VSASGVFLWTVPNNPCALG